MQSAGVPSPAGLTHSALVQYLDFLLWCAQSDSAKAVRQAAEQEASKQVAAVVAELQSGQAALTKLGKVAEAQQQQIAALQV